MTPLDNVVNIADVVNIANVGNVVNLAALEADRSSSLFFFHGLNVS